jgi:hypothetical protein
VVAAPKHSRRTRTLTRTDYWMLAAISSVQLLFAREVHLYDNRSVSKRWKRVFAALAVLACAFIVFAILFPYFARPPKRKNAMVLAGPRSLLRNADITIRCEGNVRLDRTDGDGRFMLRPEEIGKATVDGYILSRVETNTGIARLSKYGITGQLVLTAVDEQGKPYREVYFSVNRFPDRNRDIYQEPGGKLVLNDFPICVDNGFDMQPKGKTSMDLIVLHRHYDENKVSVEFVYRNKPSSQIEPIIVSR